MRTPLDRLRRHHAIEHATISVLFERQGRTSPVIARSDFSGFHIVSSFGPEDVESALAEAVGRLRAGEHQLAVTNYCGTNLVTTGVLAGGAALLAAGTNRREAWPRAMVAAISATAAAAPLGRLIQRRLTIDPAIGDISLRSIREYGGSASRRHLKVYLGSS
jgi:hypothetical protein